MKNREQQYKLYLQERENLLSDMIDFGYDLYKKLLELNTPIKEQIMEILCHLDNEIYLNHTLKKGYTYYRDILKNLKREDINIHINDDYFTVVYPIDKEIGNLFDEDCDEEPSVSVMVKYDIFYANNIDKIIEDFNNGWRQILERSVYLSSTASVLNLKNELKDLKDNQRVKVEICGKHFDLSKDFTVEDNNLILHLRNEQGII
jgi:hypothetical protein